MNWQLYLFASIWIVSLQAGDKTPSLPVASFPVELTDKTKFVPVQSTFVASRTVAAFKAALDTNALIERLKKANTELAASLAASHCQKIALEAALAQASYDAYFWQAYAQKLEEKLYPAPEALSLASSTSDDTSHQQSGRRPTINSFKE